MKKLVIFTLAFVILAGGSAFAVKTKYRAFSPTGAGKGLFLKSKTDQHKYFVVDKGTSFGFDIVGPTKVKIRVRAALKAGISLSEYEMQVWEGDQLIRGQKVKAKAASLTAEGVSTGVGVAKTLVLRVPKGKHSYRLWVTSANTDKFYARFYQAKKAVKKAKFSSFKPVEFSKQVTVKSAKNALAYYMVDTKGGAKLSVVGPAKLQVYCRVGFDKNMKGGVKFTLGMYEGTALASQFSGVAKVSTKVNFVEDGGLIPSYLYKFAFNVPSGKHIYLFKMLDSAAPGLALRFKITNTALGMVK
jgi:hypothetical protein